MCLAAGAHGVVVVIGALAAVVQTYVVLGQLMQSMLQSASCRHVRQIIHATLRSIFKAGVSNFGAKSATREGSPCFDEARLYS